MNRIFSLVFLFIILLSACNSTENKLIGVWKVDKVKTDFDENKTTPQMLEQIAEIQKQTHFQLRSDSVLIIISNNKTFEAVWSIDGENIIYYHFKNDTALHELGVFQDPFIVSKSKTALGIIETTYSKE